MLKILDRRGSFPVVDLCSVYEKSSTATCQPRRSQRHGGPTLPNPTTTELPTPEEDRNFLQRLSRVGHSETPDTSDEAEPSGDSALVSAMLGAPRRSQRSHKRSRFMDDEYLLLPWVGRTTCSDEAKVVEPKKNVGNEPAVKKRSLKSLFSAETSAKNSPKTPIDSTSPTQKGASRVVTRRSLGPVVRYPIGTRLNVKYGAVNPQIYEAKVIDVDIVPQVPRYRVHYRGWNKSHDSWITKIDVVSIIEKPSSPSSSSTTGSENAVKPSPDTTPKISTKVFPTDCKLSVSHHKGSGKDSKTITADEMDNDAENKRKKRKQDSEEDREEVKSANDGEEGGSIRERRTRSGRWKQPCFVGISSADERNPDGEASVSGSDGNPVMAEEIMEVESEARDGTDGGCVESVAEKGAAVALEAGELEKPLIDRSERNGEVEDGERSGSSGAEEVVEENGVEDGEEGSNGAEEEEMDGSKGTNDDDDDDGERDNNGSGDNGRRRDDDNDDDDDDDSIDDDDKEDDEEKEEKDSEEEDRSSDSEEQSIAPIVPVSSRSESETQPPRSSSETLIVSLDQKSTLIYDSIVTSESSSCESDSGEPAFGDDVKTMTSDDFLDEETAHDDDDDISVSNSNSDDACNDLLPAETDSVRSGGTSSITSDHHRRRPDSSGNTTTTTINTTTSSGNQLYDAESTRHFARIHSLPPPSTASFIDLEAELKGLDETEKEDYILRKMRKIQIEYKQMSSIYNKLTRRSNRASNRRKSRSRRHGNSVAIATADTEAPPVC